MRSRLTTYLLLAAVAAVWGLVAWKIFALAPDAPAAARPAPPAAQTAPPDDRTLHADYPDPFLKGNPRSAPTVSRTARTLPPAKVAAPRRERVRIVHLGTVAAAGQQLHILKIGNEQIELAPGGRAAGFELVSGDADSLYLLRDGIRYGVKRCEP